MSRNINRQPRNNSKKKWITLSVICGILLLLLLAVAVYITLSSNDGEDGAKLSAPETTTTAPTTPPATTKPTETVTEEPTSEPTEPSTEEPTQAPTEPPVTLVSTATVASTGDMLMHLPCIRPAAQADGTYQFDHYFTYLSEYVQLADYAVANLETTLCGENNGYRYQGYPQFNCPDGIVPSLQNVGFDMLLTANNHCYDTGTKGYHRTQKVLKDYGMAYTGTISKESDPNYLLADVNGIKLGMICYTYETNSSPDVVAPNGITMTNQDEVLINSFCNEDLNSFYTRIGGQLEQMREAGAEVIVLYIHWGVEYQTKQNRTQSTIAQKMCDMGVDVIVGGHPHVIQPMELLTSTKDENHKTICLYSTGNALSNQRKENMRLKTGHTEDGVLFSFTVAKYSDGTVRVEDVDLLPTWVDLYTDSATGKNVYQVYPLDDQVTDWKTTLQLSDGGLKNAQASYDRTMAIVGPGLGDIETYLQSLPSLEAEG